MNRVAQRDFAAGSPSIEAEFVDAVERSELRHQPFDHIYMDQVLDPEGYAALLAAMPDRRFYHDLRHRDALREDGTSTRLRMYLYPELLWRLPAEQRRIWLPIARRTTSTNSFSARHRCPLRKQSDLQ